MRHHHYSNRSARITIRLRSALPPIATQKRRSEKCQPPTSGRPNRSPRCQSGNPAFRNASAHFTKYFGSRNGKCLNSEICTAALISFARASAFVASSSRSNEALLAANRRTAGAKVGCSATAFSAHAADWSWRPAQKCAKATAVCIPTRNESSGLRRIARVACSIARSNWPEKFLTHELQTQEMARFGFNTSDRSSRTMARSRSRTTSPSAIPAADKAIASLRKGRWPKLHAAQSDGTAVGERVCRH